MLSMTSASYIVYLNRSSTSHPVASSEIVSLLPRHDIDLYADLDQEKKNAIPPDQGDDKNTQWRFHLLHTNNNNDGTLPVTTSIFYTTSTTLINPTPIVTSTLISLINLTSTSISQTTQVVVTIGTTTITTSCSCDESSSSFSPSSKTRLHHPHIPPSLSSTVEGSADCSQDSFGGGSACSAWLPTQTSGVMITITVPDVSGTDVFTYSLMPTSSTHFLSHHPEQTQTLLPSSITGSSPRSFVTETNSNTANPSASSTATSTPQSNTYPASSHDPLTAGQIVGVVIAAIVFVLALMLGCRWLAGVLGPVRRRWRDGKAGVRGQAAGSGQGSGRGGDSVEMLRFGGADGAGHAGAGSGNAPRQGEGEGAESSRGDFVV
ncbi:hypothetical protein BD289DRAFT_159208 [Coniella lustricola]|uniref:Uncharacterized protein n=1 Tax=Coniella lustricola TaxID=2025994 RepID=A0A2T3AEL3_9PEZI|nr:hypothetical protein BD289DRAFT_159208 [Coniella lustricola]